MKNSAPGERSYCTVAKEICSKISFLESTVRIIEQKLECKMSPLKALDDCVLVDDNSERMLLINLVQDYYKGRLIAENEKLRRLLK